ncbi:hypothetical protein ACJMK2_014641 [Sinanodonta woodiana]|uniref:Uncharacterized protein n=1 Tax=Sinanodonta woodiana TaxID=1069815 RepID=A0ABD3V4I5_SINWO
MKIRLLQPILVILCIYMLVVLYVQVNYTYVTGIISECDEHLKKEKYFLTNEHGKLILGRAKPPVLPRRLSDIKSTHYNSVYVISTENDIASEKVLVYNNTLYNWQTFKPHVQLILFTNNTSVSEKVNCSHWNIFPVLFYSDSGIPTIKAMFKQAKELYNTTWYGYFNGDILLTEDILKTLEYVSSVLDQFSNASILIIGRRINVLNVTSEEVREINGIKESARSRGSLHYIYAEDYFITNTHFPWDKIPEFVIGRAGYDNWIVGHARCDLGAIVIDATETLTAVHQDTTKDETEDGFTSADARYNFELLQRLPRRFLQGLTTCAEWKTFRTIKTGRIELVKRDDKHKDCTCKN